MGETHSIEMPKNLESPLIDENSITQNLKPVNFASINLFQFIENVENKLLVLEDKWGYWTLSTLSFNRLSRDKRLIITAYWYTVDKNSILFSMTNGQTIRAEIVKTTEKSFILIEDVVSKMGGRYSEMQCEYWDY